MATSARRVRIVNPDLNKSERTILDADYSTGTTFTVKSNYGFQDNDIVVLEEPGTEKAENGTCSGTTANTTIKIDSSLKFSHQKGAVVYRTEYDQVEISYRTSSSSSWVVLDTIGIKWDDTETIKIHQGATSNYQYRHRFKNSQSSNYSEYGPTIGGGGYNANQIGRQVDLVRSVIIDPDRKIVDDEQIIKYLTEGKNIIKAARNDWWFWLKEDEGTITTVADTRKYNLDDISTGIEYVRDIRFLDGSGSSDMLYPIKQHSNLMFDQHVTDQDEDSDDHVVRYTILPADSSSTAGYIKCDPAPEGTTGSFYVRYYEPDTDFEDVADTTAIPLPYILSDYAIAQCEKIKGNDERASFYENRFYGTASESRNRSKLTGIALLEQMQRGKLQAVGQPRVIKKFRGRRFMSRAYDRTGLDRDSVAENFFDWPIR